MEHRADHLGERLPLLLQLQATGFEAPKAVDGNTTTTRWSSLYSDPQWLQVDLGATASISRVVLRWEAAYGKAYQIQTSNDGTTWTSIYSTTTATGGVNDLAISGSGRYVRMYGTARGTAWITRDRCDGTVTRVLEGAVAVRDRKRHKTVLVRAGHRYLARR